MPWARLPPAKSVRTAERESRQKPLAAAAKVWSGSQVRSSTSHTGTGGPIAQLETAVGAAIVLQGQGCPTSHRKKLQHGPESR